jgi:hypothetical protein
MINILESRFYLKLKIICLFFNWFLGAGRDWTTMGNNFLGLGFKHPSSYLGFKSSSFKYNSYDYY